MKFDVRKVVSSVLVLLMVFCLSGCIPKHFNDAEVSDMQYKGQAAVDKWFEEFIPTASVGDAKVSTFSDNYGISDNLWGEYSVNGNSYDYVYVLSDGKMYTGEMIEAAKAKTAEMYGDGLLSGVNLTLLSCDLLLPVNCMEYVDSSKQITGSSIDDMDKSELTTYAPCFLYGMKEEETFDYLEFLFKNFQEYNGSEISFITDTAIDYKSIDFSYVQSHPYINKITIHYGPEKDDRQKDYYHIWVRSVKPEKVADSDTDRIIEVTSFKYYTSVNNEGEESGGFHSQKVAIYDFYTLKPVKMNK